MNATAPLPLTFEHLSDEVLLAELRACVVTGRENDARIVAYLVAVQDRRLYLLHACSSLYEFCKRRLGMSDGQAYRRIAAARLAKRYPFLIGLIASGATHMSALTQIRSFVTDANVHELIAETAGKNRDEIDRFLARRFGLDRIILSPRGVIVIDDELDALIQRSFELECHAVPDGNRLELTKRAYRALIEKAEKEKRAKTARPRPAPKHVTKSIPRASTRAMFEKHGEQCSYVSPVTGERCESRLFIQRNHIHMRAHGGTHAPENFEPLCGPHNRYFAELVLGRARIERAVRLRQQRQSNDDDESPVEG